MLERTDMMTNLMSPHHGDPLLAYLQTLHENQRFTDVVIQCEGAIIDCCHRLVLAAFSRHFESALAGVDGSSQITLDIDPHVTGVNVSDLRPVFDFMYTGRITSTETLFRTAKALGVTTLSNLIIKCNYVTNCYLVSEDHSEFLMHQCRRYYEVNRFTDVAIHCEGVFMRNCHRLVLSAYSDHFEAALCNTDNCPFVTLDIDAEITGVSSIDLRSILDFMYYGSVRPSRSRTKQLIIAGRSLGVKRLCDLIIAHESMRQQPQQVLQQTIIDGVFSAPGQDDFPTSSSVSRQLFASTGDVAAVEDVSGSPNLYQNQNQEEGVARGSMGVAFEEYFTPNEDDGSLADVIYDEYVIGPRRKKNPISSYRGGQMKIKSVNEPKRPAIRPNAVDMLSDGLGFFMDENGLLPPGSSTLEDPLGASSLNSGGESSSNITTTLNEEEVPSVTLSLSAPQSKRRRHAYYLDPYGYGLPEIVGGTDVTVALLVGDQRLMMEKPFKCPYCDHRTKEKSALEKHVRCIHTLEAPYQCRYCQQSFKVQSNLVRHIRAHTGEKPYICKKCGAAYADKKNMDAHVFREHLKMRPLECPSNGCSAKFWRQDRFNYHCRKQHGLEPPPEDSYELL